MNKVKSIWIYGCFVFFMSIVIVLSWDDFFWAGSQGASQLANSFDGYNGRYMGNMIVLAITRSQLLRVIVYTAVNVGIAVMMSKIIGKKVKMSYIVLILLTLPIGIFRQTFGWVSGFANYNVSVLCVLIIFFIIFKARFHWVQIFLILILGFCVQFFAENITIVTIIISFLAILYYLFFNKNIKKILLSVLWFITAVVGYVIMFQNTAYHNDSTRGMSNLHMSEIYKHILQDWLELVVKNNVFLILLFSIVIYLILSKPKIIGGYLLFFNIYFVIRDYLGFTFRHLPLYVLFGELVLILIFFGILIYAGFNGLKGSQRELYFICLIASILMVAPFVVVTPFGPRNVLLSYLLLAIALGILWSNLEVTLVDINKINVMTKYIILFLAIIILALYSVNWFENNRRINAIREADKRHAKSVTIRQLPFGFLGQYLDGLDPGERLNEFKEYYDISPDIEIKVVNRAMPLPWIQTNN